MTKKNKIIHVVGARPNFIKAAPLISELEHHDVFEQILVHTGQHYDDEMSKIFFDELGLLKPDINLEVGSASHAEQTAEVMKRFEPVVLKHAPDMALVYGDVNSTVAAALVCSKLGVPVGHVEAGLRSFDRTMPEEINRLLTDQISDLLFTPSSDGNENLLREGVADNKIHLVGNIMIDSLVRMLPEARERSGQVLEKIVAGADRKGGKYGLVTLHRPSNIDNIDVFLRLLEALEDISSKIPLIFPVHPRTRKQLSQSQVTVEGSGLYLIDPISYLDFLSLQCNASLVITDSGGIQEETTYLGVPCLTMRDNTERPITTTIGTNTIVGLDVGRLKKEINGILAGGKKQGQIPDLWDGKTASRIAQVLLSDLQTRRKAPK